MKKSKSFILILTCVFVLLSATSIVSIIKTSNSKKSTSSKNQSAPTISEDTEITKDKKVDEKTSSKNRFDGIKLSNENRPIPVLCYHDVTPNNPENNELLIHPSKFKEQLQYLKDNGYFPITLDEFYGFLRENKAIPEKSVVLTFDDGYRGNYTYAYQILKDFGFAATVFVVSDFVDNDLYMTKEQLKEMSHNGFKVESHTSKHDDLSKLNEAQQIETLKKSKDNLEKIVAQPIEYVAYPFGRSNNQTRIAAEKAGYKLGFNLNGRLADRSDNNYNIDRVYVSNNDSIEKFEYKLTKSPKN